jgi:hypothetical protein
MPRHANTHAHTHVHKDHLKSTKVNELLNQRSGEGRRGRGEEGGRDVNRVEERRGDERRE